MSPPRADDVPVNAPLFMRMRFSAVLPLPADWQPARAVTDSSARAAAKDLQGFMFQLFVRGTGFKKE
jgi:hypothetical protein